MKTNLLLTALLLCFAFGESLTAQKKSHTPENSYFGNQDYMEAAHLAKSGDLAKARTLFAKASETFVQEENWNAYIKATIKWINTYTSDPAYPQVVALSNRAIDLISNRADSLLPVCGNIYLAVADVYLNYGTLRSAHEYLEAAAKLLAAGGAEQKYALGRTYMKMGTVLSYVGQFEASEEKFEDALQIGKHLKDCEDCTGLLAAIYGNMGTMYRLKGNLEKAADYIARGNQLAVDAFGEDHLYLVGQYNSMAFVLLELREYEQAASYLKKVAAIIEQSGTQNLYYAYQVLTSTYDQLGWIYAQSNAYEKAKKYFLKAKENVAHYYDAESFLVTISCGLAKASYETKAFDEALHYLQEADSLIQLSQYVNSEPAHWQQIQSTIDLNYAGYWRKKGNYEKAAAYYKKDYQARAVLGIAKGESYSAEEDLGRLYLMSGNLDSAMHYAQRALVDVSWTFDEMDYDALPEAEDCRNVTEVYNILDLKINALYTKALLTDNPRERKQWLTKCLDVLHLADEYHMNTLSKVNLLRGGHYDVIISNSIYIYRLGAKIAKECYGIEAMEEYLDKAFYYLQQMKAQELWQSLLESDAAEYANLPVDLLEQERDLLFDEQYYEKQRLEALQAGAYETATEIENGPLFRAQKAYRELQQQLEREYTDYYAIKYDYQPAQIADLQAILKADELLIEYMSTDSSLLIFTLSQNQPLQIKEVPYPENVDESIKTLQQLLQNSAMLRRSSRRKFIALSHQLYQQFLAPVAAQLADKKRLIIIGDGFTNYIPFEVLLASKKEERFHDLNYLIRDFEISYHYSSKLLAKARKNKVANARGIYAFAPVYEDATTKNYDTAEAKGDDWTDSPLSPLPESEEEVKAIMALFRKEFIPGNTLDLREDANEAGLKKELMQAYQFIHIAGHSFANLENPKFSGIACFDQASSDAKSREDGILYSGEIYGIKTQADLVTLSSCESGYGKLDRSEGILGLNRAFIYSGTPNVMFSLWKVYDKVNARLMVDFYENILDGKEYAQSLRASKLALIERSATASPHFWAPYLLIGR